MNPTFSSSVRLPARPLPQLPSQYPQRALYQQAYSYRPAPVRRPEAPAALYVLGSFALMMVLAGVMSVVGSMAMLSLLDAEDDPPSADTVAPAAWLP